MAIDVTNYLPHTYTVHDGASGMVCTAMQRDAEGYGDSCGLPPEHPIHGSHTGGTPLRGRYFRRQVDTQVFHDDIIKVLSPEGVVYHVMSLTRETNYDNGVSTVWLQIEETE